MPCWTRERNDNTKYVTCTNDAVAKPVAKPAGKPDTEPIGLHKTPPKVHVSESGSRWIYGRPGSKTKRYLTSLKRSQLRWLGLSDAVIKKDYPKAK